jgi:predicted enzyme related to lactoylglutathione lyase
MSQNPVGWFEIYVADMNRAKAFYEKTFAMKLDKMDSPDKTMEMWTFPMTRDASGAAGALIKMEGGPTGGGTSTIVYFVSDDCSVEAGRAAAAGGKLMKEKFPIGEWGFIALITDTESNVVGIHSMK